jgi:hypothetical protein
MFIPAIAFLLFLAPVVLAQQPTPIVPDPKLTPGDSFPVTVQGLCVPGYTKKVRNVPAEMKREVYEEYGVTSHGSGEYELDHLIPLELGGSNSIKISGRSPLKTVVEIRFNAGIVVVLKRND